MTLLSPFQKQLAGLPQNSRAARTLTLTATDWNYSWDKRPAGEIVIGLRIPTPVDMERAENVANMLTERIHDEDAKRSAKRRSLEAFAVARGICDPNNFRGPHPLLEMAEETVPRALTLPAIEKILAAIAQMVTDANPSKPEATDEEIATLWRLLAAGDVFEGLDAGRIAEAREHLKIAYDALTD